MSGPGEAALPPRTRFDELTETTGTRISEEGASMMYTRYSLACRLAAGKRVLEVGCGPGQGLRLLGSSARGVVGGDYSIVLLRSARSQYQRRFPLVCLSADQLPICTATFDLVVCFETSYYVPDMTQGFKELVRVLRPGGTLVFANANPERDDFISSPHSTHYHTADEFRSALAGLGLEVEVQGAFPVQSPSSGPGARLFGTTLAAARRGLERLHLVPRTLRGRARLKRLIYGRLREVPAELTEGFAREAPLTPLPSGPAKEWKVLYVSARKPA